MKANNQKEPAYITKRILLQTSYRAIKLASKKAMRIAGYIVKPQEIILDQANSSNEGFCRAY